MFDWLSKRCLGVLIVASVVVFEAFPQRVRADAIVIAKAMSASTIAEVFVDQEAVRVELEIGPDDIHAFRNILPDEIFRRFAFEPTETETQRLENFFDKDFSILNGKGESIGGFLRSIDVRRRIQRDEVTGEPSSIQTKDAPVVIYAELEYKLPGQPNSISIRPPIDPETGFVDANIGFITYHRNLPVMEFRYLSQEETLDLNWSDPWYSKYRNQNLWRQYNAPLSAYLYVEPFEVRVEVVVRPVDLQRWTDLGVQTDTVIPVSSQAALKARVADFLKDKVTVTIDGRPAAGTLDRIHFIRRTLRKTGVIYPDEDLYSTAATLGVIYIYHTESLPQQVKMQWTLFDDKISQVPATATDEAGELPAQLSADDPVLVWKNYLINPTIPAMRAVPPPSNAEAWSIPAISLGCGVLAMLVVVAMVSTGKRTRLLTLTAGLALILGIASIPLARFTIADPLAQMEPLSEENLDAVVDSLLHNVYHAFDRRDEGLVYDQLATSVSGALLRDLYLQTQRRISLVDQGGAQIKIDKVEVLGNHYNSFDRRGLECQCNWRVSGTIGHWGHLHRRQLDYEADLRIEPIDGSWKITEMQVVKQRQPVVINP